MGVLAAAFERLRVKLEAEGLFDEFARKRPLPRFPSCIALVTSPTGAVVQDLKNILTRRYPPARILILPTQVQGDDAPDSIVRRSEPPWSVMPMPMRTALLSRAGRNRRS